MRAWLRSRPDAEDAVITIVVGIVCLGILFVARDRSGSYRSADWFGVLLVVALCLPLPWRRRHPIAVALALAVPTLLVWGFHYADGTTALAGAVVTYGIGRHLARPRSVQTIVPLAAVLTVAAFVTAPEAGSAGFWHAFSRVTLIGLSFAVGEGRRNRAALLAGLRERAERAEADRTAEAERAVAEERARIARELHDVVAHSLSVMVVQATAAERLAPRDAARAAAAIATVADTGRSALREMRRILGVLDGGDGAYGANAPYAPQPGLAELPALVERCREAGVDVDLVIGGAPWTLGPGAELAVYRIVQEALTNVLKHAGPASAHVRVRFGDVLTIVVSDDGRGAAAAPSDRAGGPGRGLVGMRERVEAFGGHLSTGPRPGGGFAVRVELPASIAAAPGAAVALPMEAGPAEPPAPAPLPSGAGG